MLHPCEGVGFDFVFFVCLFCYLPLNHDGFHAPEIIHLREKMLKKFSTSTLLLNLFLAGIMSVPMLLGGFVGPSSAFAADNNNSGGAAGAGYSADNSKGNQTAVAVNVKNSDTKLPKENTVVEPVKDFFFFYSSTCPHCKEAKPFIAELKTQYPDFRFYQYEIRTDVLGRELFRKICEDNNFYCRGIPAFVIGNDYMEGFSDKANSRERLTGLLDKYREQAKTKAECANKSELITVPLLGEINPKMVSLPSFTFVLGLLDGINPCAMWVLMFLLTLLVNTKSRKKMLLIGGIFVGTSSLVYFLFMTAWFNFFTFLGLRNIVTIILGSVTIIIGLINIKDFFFFKKGVSMVIPDKAKPKLYSKARRIINAEHLGIAVGGTMALALFVNIIELGCTIGLPAIYTRVLSLQQVSTASKYLHMALYNIYYVIPLGLIVGGFVITMGKRQLDEKHARVLKLISGGLMLGLGLILILYPELLVFG